MQLGTGPPRADVGSMGQSSRKASFDGTQDVPSVSRGTEHDALPVQAVGAAHDLRNVLFVISAHCHRLLQLIQPGDPGSDDLHAIKDASDRGMALARHMISATSAQLPPRPVDVNEVIDGLEPLLRRMVGGHIDISIRLGTGAWPVQVTATQIEQVIMNLAVNARDAMPEGGQLSIVTENRCVPAAGAAPAAHYLVISVIDTGIGMDADLQARIFEPYFTTKRETGGTGIGLGTVRSIATMAGGQVEVSSASGEGTTMRVVLPRADVCMLDVESPADARETAAPAKAAVAGQRPSGNRKRVLLVEDENVVRELLQRWLTLLGYDTILARKGEEAFAQCAANRGRIDLVLTDLHLPDAKGVAIARALHERLPDVPIVVMSGETEPLRAAARDERTTALTKPFSLSELTTAVDTALNSAKCPVTP